jgi:N-acetylmuramoyl-L-alanine amidase
VLRFKLLLTSDSYWSCLARLSSFCVVLFIFSGCASEITKERRTFQTVVVDAGHGGHDSGALARHVPPEKVWTLAVAQALSQELADAGFNVRMTRRSDVFIPLDERVYVSNASPNAIFVSIHFNSAGWKPYVHGVETYYDSNDSLPLAKAVHAKILQIPYTTNRGVKKAAFRVIRKNAHAAILVEGGFLTNSWEASRIASPNYRSYLASQICAGIIAYRGSSPPRVHRQSRIDSVQPSSPISSPLPYATPAPASTPEITLPPTEPLP